MQPHDRKAFLEVVLGFAELKGRQLSGAALELYWNAMQEWSIEDFKSAANQLLRTAEFMPMPKDFFELRKAARPTSGEAWQLACGKTDDPLIQRARHIATQGRYLGHIDLDELKWVQRRFCEVYDELQDVTETRHALPHLAGLPPLLAAPGRSGLSKL